MKYNPITDLFNLLFPDLCVVCGNNLLRNEQHICLSCLHNIPKTNYHLFSDNPVDKRFWGKVPICSGTAFFFFQKGSSFQKLLHSLKYKGNKEIGEVLGKYAAADLSDTPYFETVDVIIPVPLHPKKLKKRGYNQSEWIAMGLSLILEKPCDTTSLFRLRESDTQTKKTVFQRYENTEGLFGLLDKNTLSGKHVLLVDDVLTTGSTLEACIQMLLKCEDIKVSVFTLAVA
ncbi:MAG TPA: ComF family protein [Paludibacter sp.]